MLRVLLLCLALPVLALIALFIKNPEAVILVLGMLVYPLFGNTTPPPMFKADIPEAWNKWEEGGRKITAELQAQFPAGTTEATLKSTLRKQGFKPLPPPRADCVPPGQPTPIGKPYTPCPTRDPSKTLVYKWSGGVCTSTISVHWESDGNDAITRLEGGYDKGCL